MNRGTELIPLGDSGGSPYLVKMFRVAYTYAHRQYQAERGQRPTYRPPREDKQNRFQAWRDTVVTLTKRQLNPLQVVRHEMRRYQSLNEPEAPSLRQIAACRIDAVSLEEETYSLASTALMSDMARIRRIKTTASSLFGSLPSEAQLAAEIVSSVSSHVLIASTLDATEGLKPSDTKLINLAVIEYLECPQAYVDLRLSFVTNHLRKLKDFYSLM